VPQQVAHSDREKMAQINREFTVSDALQITGGATVVPEPGTILLFGTGLFGVASAIRRRVPR
jgi:hypothetical protein